MFTAGDQRANTVPFINQANKSVTRAAVSAQCILIVEDDHDVSLLLSYSLEPAGDDPRSRLQLHHRCSANRRARSLGVMLT